MPENQPAEIPDGNWAVTSFDTNRRYFALTLPQAEAMRHSLKKSPLSRVTVRPLTEAAVQELYQFNNWPREVNG